MTDGTALREIAAEILTEILEKGQYTHLALFQALSKYQYLDCLLYTSDAADD